VTTTGQGRDDWERELGAMEAHLGAQRAAFARRLFDHPVRAPRPLDELGPLPKDLQARAEELLRATRAFEGEVIDARAARVEALRQSRSSDRRAAAYVDSRL
jgi:hypothetical protein